VKPVPPPHRFHHESLAPVRRQCRAGLCLRQLAAKPYATTLYLPLLRYLLKPL
jgi:hypothetical protein